MITQNKITTITGAKAIISTLKQLNVDTVFGYPGGVVVDIYDELYKDKSVKHILTRHEQSAVHAAEGYARQTDKCGVVIVTSGPGATNTITGIVNAYIDGYPLIVLTGQVSNTLIGTDAFQEANICDMVKSCTKAAFQIKSAKDIQSTIFKAYEIAMTGKKGPVVIDMVKDIFKESVVFKDEAIFIKNKSISSDNYISELIKAIENSKKPLVISGGGVKHSKAEEELLKFIQKTNIPVVCTMMGLGTFPQNDSHYFGMLGVFGDNSANQMLTECDIAISLGARLNDKISKRNELNGKLYQIDINPNEISKNVKTDKFIIGDIKQILNTIKINKNFLVWNDFSQNIKSINKKQSKTTNLLHAFEVLQAIEEYTKDRNMTFTSEVGQHQLWAVRNLKFSKNRKIFVSGGSGTMGFGLPAAIGASIADKNNCVVCITGDGSFQMSLHELATCKENNLNIKIMILNNGYLGMVRQIQEKQCDGRYSQTKISNPDFVTLAKSYGIDAIRVNNHNEIKAALEKAFSTDNTFIIDFVIEPMEIL